MRAFTRSEPGPVELPWPNTSSARCCGEPFHSCAAFSAAFPKAEPYKHQGYPSDDKQPWPSVKMKQPGVRLEPQGLRCCQRASAIPGRQDAGDEEEQATANSQIAAPSLLMLPGEKVSAWLAGANPLPAAFKGRPYQEDEHAQRPCLSKPDPWLVDSVHVVRRAAARATVTTSTARMKRALSFSRDCAMAHSLSGVSAICMFRRCPSVCDLQAVSGVSDSRVLRFGHRRLLQGISA